jgi:hypothetical protein
MLIQALEGAQSPGAGDRGGDIVEGWIDRSVVPPGIRRTRAAFSRRVIFAGYSEMTHTLEGVRPEKRLSYIGKTCVAGHRNLPTAVARARTEYWPGPEESSLK